MATVGGKNIVEIIIQGRDATTAAANTAGRNFEKLNKLALASAKAIAAAGIATAAAMVVVTKRAIDNADAMGKLAQSAGTTTEFFSAFNHAAELGGATTENVAMGFRMLNEQIVKNGTALRELGIATRDTNGNLRSVEQIAPEIADRFADMADGAQKAELASRLFGSRVGGALIPTLNAGSRGLKEAADEARKFGLIVDSQAAKQAEQFNDNLTRLSMAARGLGMKVAEELLPHLVKFSETLVKIVNQEQGINTLFDTINGRIASSVPFWKATQDRLTNIFTLFHLGQMGMDINDPENKAAANAPNGFGEAEPKVVTVDNLPTKKTIPPPPAPLTEKALALNDELLLATLDGITQMQAAEELRYTKRLEQIEELGMAEEEARKFREMAEKEHSNKVIDIAEQEKTRKQQLQKLTLQVISQNLSAAADLAQTFGKKGFKVWKALATANAIVKTYEAANSAYAALAGIPGVGPALGAAAAAAAIVAGIANVRAIQQTEPAGAAHGGLGYVPNESTYLLQRGERVLSPEQNRDMTEFIAQSGGGGGGVTHVHVSISDRELFSLILEGTRDGRLEIAGRSVI